MQSWYKMNKVCRVSSWSHTESWYCMRQLKAEESAGPYMAGIRVTICRIVSKRVAGVIDMRQYRLDHRDNHKSTR